MTKKRLSIILASIAVVLAVTVVFALGLVFPDLYKPATSGSKPSPTPTSIQTPKVNQLDRIFDPSKISETFIELPKASIAKLNSSKNESYVAAKFRMVYDGTETQTVNVGIRIKGNTTRSTLNSTWKRASYKVKFDWAKGYESQTFFGKRSLTFNAFHQDGSRLHETYAYSAYRAMGVPAPRTGFTTITFEGKAKPNQPKRGLFLLLESEDKEFFAENFSDVTQHVYESNDFVTDFDAAKVGRNVVTSQYWVVKQGWKATPNRNDLRTFTKAVSTNGKKFWDNLDTYADREKLIMLFAVDNFTGNWDTYSGPLRNNITIRSNSLGKFTFVPWGTDQSFGENLFNDPGAWSPYKGYKLPVKVHDDFFINIDKPYTAYPGSYTFAYTAGIRDMSKMANYQINRGKIFQKCLAYKPCSTTYFQYLQKVSDWAKSTQMSTQMKTTTKLINKHLSSYQKIEAARTAKWVTQQIGRVESAIKRNCKLDSSGLVSSCKGIRG